MRGCLNTMLSIHKLVEQDIRANSVQLVHINKDKDPSHVERRQQQRAISDELAQVALAYGTARWDRGSQIKTLNDRNLKKTIYQKYISKLRGLSVVYKEENSIYHLTTVCWNYNVKAKVRI